MKWKKKQISHPTDLGETPLGFPGRRNSIDVSDAGWRRRRTTATSGHVRIEFAFELNVETAREPVPEDKRPEKLSNHSLIRE